MLQYGIGEKENLDQTAQLRSLIRVFSFRIYHLRILRNLEGKNGVSNELPRSMAVDKLILM